MTSITCPTCKLLNPSSAQRCDCGYDFVERKGPPKRPKPVGWAFVVAGGAMTFNAVLALAEGRRAFGVVHQSVFVAMGVLLCAWGVLELRSRGAAKSD